MTRKTHNKSLLAVIALCLAGLWSIPVFLSAQTVTATESTAPAPQQAQLRPSLETDQLAQGRARRQFGAILFGRLRGRMARPQQAGQQQDHRSHRK